MCCVVSGGGGGVGLGGTQDELSEQFKKEIRNGQKLFFLKILIMYIHVNWTLQ